MTITEFLLACIAEDEEWAKARSQIEWQGGHIVRMADTAVASRLRRECEAKRRIVRFHGSEMLELCQEGCPGLFPCRTLRAIAAVYADHPDHRAEWRA